MTKRHRSALATLLVPLFATLAFAQESPDELLGSELKCEQQMARAAFDDSERLADCILECQEAQIFDPTRFCGPFGFDVLTELCFDRTTLSSRIRTQRRCNAEACPECYNNCEFRLDNEIFNARTRETNRLNLIACDDSGSTDGLNATEEKCQERRLTQARRLERSLRQCSSKCHKRRQAGKSTEAECSQANLDTSEVAPSFQACVDRARVRFLRSCFRCDDEPECWNGQACADVLEQTATTALLTQSSLFCVDQPICGDGRVSGTEECDFNAFPSVCAPDEICGQSCACEPPPVCGDGQVTGFEFCDPTAPTSPCGEGFVCNESCDGCAQDRCADVTTIPAEGGTFTGFTTGVSALQSACDTISNFSDETVFAWTPTSSGTAGLETCGSTPFNTSLHVRTTCNDPTSTVACDDDTCGSHAQIRMEVEAGTTYFIVLEAFNGEFRLVVTPPGVYGSPTRAFLDAPQSLLE